MSTSYATILQRLCKDYANHRIRFDEYRARRRAVLEKVDEQFNGVYEPDDAELTLPGLPSGEFGLPVPEHDEEKTKPNE